MAASNTLSVTSVPAMAKPPYDPPPKAPLSKPQKQAIANWLEVFSKYQTGSVGPNDTAAHWMKTNDTLLLVFYGRAVDTWNNNSGKPGTLPGGENPGIPTVPTPDIGSFLAALTNPHTWVRVGEAGIGIILIGIGLSAAMKAATGHSASDVGGSFKTGARRINSTVTSTNYRRVPRSSTTRTSVGGRSGHTSHVPNRGKLQ